MNIPNEKEMFHLDEYERLMDRGDVEKAAFHRSEYHRLNYARMNTATADPCDPCEGSSSCDIAERGEACEGGFSESDVGDPILEATLPDNGMVMTSCEEAPAPEIHLDDVLDTYERLGCSRGDPLSKYIEAEWTQVSSPRTAKKFVEALRDARGDLEGLASVLEAVSR